MLLWPVLRLIADLTLFLPLLPMMPLCYADLAQQPVGILYAALEVPEAELSIGLGPADVFAGNAFHLRAEGKALIGQLEAVQFRRLLFQPGKLVLFPLNGVGQIAGAFLIVNKVRFGGLDLTLDLLHPGSVLLAEALDDGFLLKT